MVRTLEDFSVELFYEIFIHLQLHEIFNIFSNLNSRITAMIDNLPSISVYLGCRGMNIEVANFYYQYLSQTSNCMRLTSLYVSDAFAVGNSLWFAKHGSTFINLRYLSLVGIQRSSFEMILNSLSPIDSLIMFSLHFVSPNHRVACTFGSVSEGAYHERIFRLFPSLRVCHLLFGGHDHHSIYDPFWNFNKSFVPIQSNLSNLQSLTLRYCSPEFLAHLFEHLSQLEQCSCHLLNTFWMDRQHPLEQDYDNQCTPINKRLAPNLRRLKMNWVKEINLKSIEMLFEDDVLFSLTNFTLLAKITDVGVLHNVLSKVSSQCSYRFDVTWDVMDDGVSLSNTSYVLWNIFEQFKRSTPIELELYSKGNDHSMRAMTLPRMDVTLFVDSYLDKNLMDRQSRWPLNKDLSNNRWFRSTEIRMSDRYDQTNGEFLSLSSCLICWDRIISIHILQPFNSTYLHVLFSQAINLRILNLEYLSEFDRQIYLKDKTFIDLINDESLCNILMSNGLRQLNLITGSGQTNLIDLAHLIVERLPHLEAIEVHCELPDMASILINGLSKLSFIALTGQLDILSILTREIALFDPDSRSSRMELTVLGIYGFKLLIWL